MIPEDSINEPKATDLARVRLKREGWVGTVRQISDSYQRVEFDGREGSRWCHEGELEGEDVQQPARPTFSDSGSYAPTPTNCNYAEATISQQASGKCTAIVAGVGPDAPVTVNEAGGKQSDSPYRADLLPTRAVLEVCEVLKHGSKYGEGNWRLIPARSHLNHALVHVFAWLAGDRSDKHLSHAACRLLMALETVE